MRGEQAIFNLEIKKKSGLSINPDIYHSKVPSSAYLPLNKFYIQNHEIVSKNTGKKFNQN